MRKEFHIIYKKFAIVYLFYPVIMMVFVYSERVPLDEIISSCVIGSIICIVLSHLLYKIYVNNVLLIVVTDDALMTYNLSGVENKIPFSLLIGPIKENFFIIKRYTFMNMENDTQKIIFTNITENVPELLDLVKNKSKEAHEKS